MTELIQRKKEERTLQFKKLEENLTNDNNFNVRKVTKIVEDSSFNIVQKLKNGQLSAVQVLKAFQYKALQVTKELNCVTEFIQEAQNWAADCDRIPSEKRKPLHGLPVSIKESYFVEGTDATIGVSKYLYDPSSEHAIVVQALIQNGAVPFCKTNASQTLLSFCCSNPIYGLTLNPHDKSRTPGGSTGGESALIAGGGSLVGIGSDLGGSSRVPASMCGIYGLKFTSTRVSHTGLRETHNVMAGLASSTGVMGRDSFIISLVAKAIIDSQETNLKDWTICPGPWKESLFKQNRQLTFGYWDESPILPCTPGVKRAVHEAKEALERIGHKAVPFEISNPETICDETFKIMNADFGKTLFELLDKEIIDPSIAKCYFEITSGPHCKDVYDLWQCFNKRKIIVQELNDSMTRQNIDLLISPVYPMPAPQHYIPASAIVGKTIFYTVFANYCDFSSGVVPVTTEKECDQELLKNYSETDPVLKIVKTATEGATGMPIGVLITAKSFQEELVLKCMQNLEEALRTTK